MALVIKRVAWAVALAAPSIGAVLGVEVVIAMRREYLPTEPALDIGGTFGDGDEELTFVVLGDSTAAGLGAGEASQSYPVLLAERLARAGRTVTLIDLGVSGHRVIDVLDRQVPEARAARPDLVFIGIGANDVIHLTELGEIEHQMGEILVRLQDDGAAIVVAGAPDMRAAAFLEPLRSIVGWRGDAVTTTIEETARAAGVTVVPLAAWTRGFFAADPEGHYSPDDFHPGPLGYRRWADAIYPYLERALTER